MDCLKYYHRVRIIFSEMICKNLVISSNRQGVWGSTVSSPIEVLSPNPPKTLSKMLSEYKKMVYSLTLFGVTYKQIVTLTTFTDTLRNVLQLLNQLFFAMLCLLFNVKSKRKMANSEECFITHVFSPVALGRSINFLISFSTEML